MGPDLAHDLLRVSITVCVATLTILLLRPLVRKLGGPGISYGLWALVPLAVACTFLPAPPSWLASTDDLVLSRPILATTAAAQHAVSAALTAGLPAGAGSSSAGLSIPFLQLWLAGAGIMLARLLWLEARLSRQLARLRPDPDLRDVYYMDGPEAGPMVVGLWKSKIILPSDFSQRYEMEERQLILAHERAHVQGRHMLAGAIAYLLLVTQWFNPLAHVAMAVFRVDQELACDAMVVAAHPHKRASYARAMFKTGMSRVSAPLACGWSRASSNPTRRRIAMLKVAGPGRAQRWLGGAITVLAVVFGSLVAYAASPSTSLSALPRIVAPLATLNPAAPLTSKSSTVLPASRSGGVSARRQSKSPEPQDDISTDASVADLQARRDAILGRYYQADPGALGGPLAPLKVQAVLGDEAYNQFRAVNNALYAARQADPAPQAEPPAQDDGPFSFVVPRGLSRDDAARAAGLADSRGYGVDRAGAPGLETMVRCGVPQTPATARC